MIDSDLHSQVMAVAAFRYCIRRRTFRVKTWRYWVIDSDLHSQVMAVAAFRYSVRRRTFMVKMCVAWLTENWPGIEAGSRSTILKEVREALDAGWDPDDEDVRRQWEAFLKQHEGL